MRKNGLVPGKNVVVTQACHDVVWTDKKIERRTSEGNAADCQCEKGMVGFCLLRSPRCCLQSLVPFSKCQNSFPLPALPFSPVNKLKLPPPPQSLGVLGGGRGHRCIISQKCTYTLENPVLLSRDCCQHPSTHCWRLGAAFYPPYWFTLSPMVWNQRGHLTTYTWYVSNYCCLCCLWPNASPSPPNVCGFGQGQHKQG